jgi:transposase
MKGKKTFISLTNSQRLELKEGYRNGKKGRFRRRCHILLLSDKGKTIAEIMDFVEISRPSIHTCFNLYQELGITGLQRNKGGGRPPIIKIENQAEIDRIKEIVSAHPQQLKNALPIIEKEFGITVSKQTLIRFLKKTVARINNSEL